MAKKLYRWYDSSGGLNEMTASHLLEDNELQEIKNFDFTEKGKLVTRRGHTLEKTFTATGDTEIDDFDTNPVAWVAGTGTPTVTRDTTNKAEGTASVKAVVTVNPMIDACDSGWTNTVGTSWSHETTAGYFQQGTASCKYYTNATNPPNGWTGWYSFQKNITAADFSLQESSDRIYWYATRFLWYDLAGRTVTSAVFRIRLLTSGPSYYYYQYQPTLLESPGPDPNGFVLRSAPKSSFSSVGSPSWSSIVAVAFDIKYCVTGAVSSYTPLITQFWADALYWNPKRIYNTLYHTLASPVDYSGVSAGDACKIYYGNYQEGTGAGTTTVKSSFRFETSSGNYYYIPPTSHTEGAAGTFEEKSFQKNQFYTRLSPDWSNINKLVLYCYISGGTDYNSFTITTRYDRAKWVDSDAAANSIRGIYEYSQKDGDKVKVVAITTGLKNWDNTDILTSMTANKDYSFATFKDLLIIANGTDNVKKWNGTGAGANLGSGSAWSGGLPPICKYLKVHENRLWCAGYATAPSYLIFSKLADPDAADSWPAANFIECHTDDGQVITGMAQVGGRLVIFKEKSTWVLYAKGDPSTWELYRVENIGCPAPRSIVEAEGGVFYLSDDYRVRFFDGTRSASLMETRVEESIKSRIVAANADDAAGAYWNGRYRIWFCATDGPSGGVSNDTALVWNKDLKNWTVWEGIQPNCFAIMSGVLYAGLANYPQVISCDTENYDDAGAPISVSVTTKDFSMKFPDADKIVRRIIHIAESNVTNYGMTTTVTKDFDTTNSTIEEVSLYHPTDKVIEYRGNLSGRNKYFRINYSHTGVDEPLSLIGATFIHKVKKTR